MNEENDELPPFPESKVIAKYRSQKIQADGLTAGERENVKLRALLFDARDSITHLLLHISPAPNDPAASIVPNRLIKRVAEAAQKIYAALEPTGK